MSDSGKKIKEPYGIALWYRIRFQSERALVRNFFQILKENWEGGKSLTTSKFKSMVPSSEGTLPSGSTGIEGSGGSCG